ncbi:MAG: hypothetical protein ACE5G1_16655 [bacterium]
MYQRMISLVIAAVALFAIACGGTGSGKAGGSKADGDYAKRASKFRRNMGTCRKNQFTDALTQILFTKHNFQDSGDTRDLRQQVEYRTEWKPRFPFDDEKALGIVKVESKIVVGAKSSGSIASLSGEASFKAYLEAENRVKYANSVDWQPGPMTAEAKKYFRNIADDMEQQFKSAF